MLPLRAAGAMTTTELRTQDFQFVVAPCTDGTATVAAVDDGLSVTQRKTTSVAVGKGSIPYIFRFFAPSTDHVITSGNFPSNFPSVIQHVALSLSRLPATWSHAITDAAARSSSDPIRQ